MQAGKLSKKPYVNRHLFSFQNEWKMNSYKIRGTYWMGVLFYLVEVSNWPSSLPHKVFCANSLCYFYIFFLSYEVSGTRTKLFIYLLCKLLLSFLILLIILFNSSNNDDNIFILRWKKFLPNNPIQFILHTLWDSNKPNCTI